MSKESTILKQQRQINDLQRQLTDAKAEIEEWKEQARLAYTGADSDVMMRAFNPWKLTWKELTLLFAILRRRNGVSREQIMSALYTGESVDHQPEIKIVDVFVCKLRRKLANPDNPQYAVPKTAIKTVWGRGYRVEPEDHKLITDILGYDPGAVDKPEQPE
jgi:DNA-binding response OmpR family regulator